MGNPAGVVLAAERLDTAMMQHLAQAVRFNETVFILPSDCADLRLRYFTPGQEVDLCGHATTAAFIALHMHGFLPDTGFPRALTLKTRAGLLPITVELGPQDEPWVVMTQNPARFAVFQGDRAALAKALGVDQQDFHQDLPILYGSTGVWTLVVPVRDLAAIRRMQPRNAEFPDILREMPTASIHPFCLEVVDPTADMHARHFSSPYSGTVEDPVTGTASGVLGAYYREFVQAAGDQAPPLLVEQGLEVGRDGRVRVWAVKENASYAVRIAGTGCLVGELTVDLEPAAVATLAVRPPAEERQ